MLIRKSILSMFFSVAQSERDALNQLLQCATNHLWCQLSFLNLSRFIFSNCTRRNSHLPTAFSQNKSELFQARFSYVCIYF